MIEALKQGDRVAIVATAKQLEREIDGAIDKLEDWGLEVKLFDSVKAKSQYFAGTDELRLTDCQKALDDESIKMVLFARGGYGTTRILDQLDFSDFNKRPKWLCGFSDLTSILLQVGKSDLPAIHGPMAYTLGQDFASDKMLKELLWGERNFSFDDSGIQVVQEGEVDAMITGGNLSLIYESIGAANEIDTQGKILFLEEIGEELYAIDRMMNKLKRTQKLEALKGLVIGDFTNIKDSSGYFHTDVNSLLLDYFKDLKGPIIQHFSAGHERQNYPILFHHPTRFTVGKRSVQFSYL